MSLDQMRKKQLTIQALLVHLKCLKKRKQKQLNRLARKLRWMLRQKGVEELLVENPRVLQQSLFARQRKMVKWIANPKMPPRVLVNQTVTVLPNPKTILPKVAVNQLTLLRKQATNPRMRMVVTRPSLPNPNMMEVLHQKFPQSQSKTLQRRPSPSRKPPGFPPILRVSLLKVVLNLILMVLVSQSRVHPRLKKVRA
ncbi:hypothetical protein V6Z11_D06G118000 [Gossypium hirsutum]